VGPKGGPGLEKGYVYAGCKAEVLLNRLTVSHGWLVLPDGMKYRLLVLPESRRMPVEVLQKIEQLVEAGATIVGPRPESDPGLRDYPKCDETVRRIAARLWGKIDGQAVTENHVGRGRVFAGQTPGEILRRNPAAAPDCELLGPADTFIDYIHRATPDADFYFLANRNDRPENVEAIFRQTGRQPELWEPLDGTQRERPSVVK